MPDFTLHTYRALLTAFQKAGYTLIPFRRYLEEEPEGKYVILRHDVDELAGNALKMATLEHQLGICATYYFRRVKGSDEPAVIKAIAAMGHEIGYHYEDLADSNGDTGAAYRSFAENLAYFRTYAPVTTVCMHGSSASPYDNRDLWRNGGLREYGIMGEPYLSTDFSRVYYLTDTGYCWDGTKYAYRDVAPNPFGLHFHKTSQIIRSLKAGEFPPHAMLLAHTLWTDSGWLWLKLHLRQIPASLFKRAARNNKYVYKLYALIGAKRKKSSK
ncbi:MAG: hypothetical protein J5871_02030 [Bacteroidales bacterium]|nr:hypothetical protein [Bacteroidales bacterium]